MARLRPPERLDELVDAAAQVFSRRGYRRTQMADVARELGVAPGTLYRYVAGKDALFDLCVQRAFLGADEAGPPPALPVATPTKDDLLEHVRTRLRGMRRSRALEAALARKTAEDPVAELAGLVRDHYAYMVENRRGSALIERSAADRPELAELYFGRGRGKLLARWTRYLELRIAAGQFRPVPDPAIAARLLIEAVAWFAWHRHGDPHPVPIDDAAACETIVAFAVRALVQEASR